MLKKVLKSYYLIKRSSYYNKKNERDLFLNTLLLSKDIREILKKTFIVLESYTEVEDNKILEYYEISFTRYYKITLELKVVDNIVSSYYIVDDKDFYTYIVI